MWFTMLSPNIYTRLVTLALVSDGLVLLILGFSSLSCTFFWFSSFFSPGLLAVLDFWVFRICLHYVNITFIFSETVVMIGIPMNGIFLFYNCFLWCILYRGITSILLFLRDFAHGRFLHDEEVQSSMDLHFILSKVLTTFPLIPLIKKWFYF